MMFKLCDVYDERWWNSTPMSLNTSLLINIPPYFQFGSFLNWWGIMPLGGWHGFYYEKPGYFVWYYYGRYWWGYMYPPSKTDEFRYSFDFPSLVYGGIGRVVLPLNKNNTFNLFGEFRLGEMKLAGAKYQLTRNAQIIFKDKYSGKTPFSSFGGGITSGHLD